MWQQPTSVPGLHNTDLRCEGMASATVTIMAAGSHPAGTQRPPAHSWEPSTCISSQFHVQFYQIDLLTLTMVDMFILQKLTDRTSWFYPLPLQRAGLPAHHRVNFSKLLNHYTAFQFATTFWFALVICTPYSPSRLRMKFVSIDTLSELLV